MTIKDLKQGDFFTLHPITEPEEDQVWVRDEYDRSLKLFEAHRFDDISEIRFFQGIHVVFTDFVF